MFRVFPKLQKLHLPSSHTKLLNCVFKGTPEKLIDQLKFDGDGGDTYVEDFLLTYRTFVRTTRDITSRLLAWCSDYDYKLRDKVF